MRGPGWIVTDAAGYLPDFMPDFEPEEWRPAPGSEGRAEVSSRGRVRSLVRSLGAGGIALRDEPMILRLHPIRGYPGVNLVVAGRQRTRYVHLLVLVAFRGPRPPGLEALHHDGNPRNNDLSNLRWGTRSENTRDSIRHGTFRSGITEEGRLLGAARRRHIGPRLESGRFRRSHHALSGGHSEPQLLA